MDNRKILVWDLPTRIFHWMLAVSFLGAFLTSESDRLLDLHLAFGYTMLGLVAFRLLWGLIGSRYARFGSFAFAPRRVVAYVRAIATFSPQHHVGHNPAGSWAVYALLALAFLAGATGYATYGDLGGDWMEDLHEGAANTLMAIVIVHIAGVIVSSLVHRENLVRAMVSGYKRGAPHEGIRHRHRFVAATLVAAVLGFWLNGADVLPSLGKADQVATARQGNARQGNSDEHR
jgi:cytochrome b